MKSKILALLFIVSLFLASISIMATRFEASAQNTDVDLYIDPPLISKNPGDVDSFFDVYVTIDDVTGLFGFDIEITWDNALINFDSYDTTPLNTVWSVAPGWEEALHTISPGSFKLVALSLNQSFTKDPGSQVLYSIHFKIVKACNFVLQTDIHFAVHKLSDSAWTAIPHTVTDGHYYMDKTIPDLDFELVNPDSKLFEYCKTFQVKVNVTHICAQLKDYDFTILYTAELLKLTGVDWTGGVLGGTSDGASFTEPTAGTINIVDTGGTIWSGETGLLFTLTFHIEFDDRDSHIWRTTTAPNTLPSSITFSGAELSFVEGIIVMSGITMPLPVDITVYLIRGDIACDGDVDLFDLRTVAYYYDQSNAKYDLNSDGIIDIFDLVIIATNYGYPS